MPEVRPESARDEAASDTKNPSTAEPAVGRVDAIQGEILHVYDGIEEADNELPNWWLWTFYGAIVFSVFYWFAYHEFESAALPPQQYAQAMQARAAGGEITEDLLVALVADRDTVSAGASLYQTNCAVCHADRGEGNIGPNLTDAFWVHGGSALDIHQVISEGALQNGMPAWGGTLGPEKVRQLTAFVLSIRDTNVSGKEPQGERWVPGARRADEGGDDESGDDAAGDGTGAGDVDDGENPDTLDADEPGPEAAVADHEEDARGG
ncbi:MAG: c-type cytochrome [Myxococcales bacterium]|nr:c-type cytochrome [Myxococcales bacterium]